MTNGDNGGQIADEVMHSIEVECNWPDYRPTERAVIHVDPAILAQYVGTYQLHPNFDISVTLEKGQLVAHPTAQPDLPLYPDSETKFFSLVPIEIEFVKDEQGKVTSLILHQGGRDLEVAHRRN